MINIKTLEINSQKYELNNNLEEGFLKGSAWNNLYSFYKYKPDKIKLDNDLERLIYIYQVYNFISLELTLFIATHKDDKIAMEELNKINNYLCKINNKLEEMGFSISRCSRNSQNYFNMKNPWSDN